MRTASGAQGQLSIVSGEGGQAGCLVWGIRHVVFCPTIVRRLGWGERPIGAVVVYTKIAKNARHREIPILEQTVKSTVGSWGFGSRDLPGATRRALVFVGIASVCSSLSRGLLIPWPSDTQTLAPLVVPHAHFQSASARACICSCHVESSLPLVALAVPFCVRWTYYHPSSVFILKFSAPLFVASIFSLF